MHRKRKNFFCFPSKEDKINKLLAKEDVILTEILEIDTLSSSIIENSNQQLFNYLNQQDIMEELLKWSITDLYRDSENYIKLSNASTSIFTNCSKTLQKMIIENPIFLDELQQFTLNDLPSERSCGNYYKIIESTVCFTNGEFLYELSSLPKFLMSNINSMPLKDLFVLMSSSFPEQFKFNTDIIIELISKINDENGLFIVSAIRDILNNNKSLKEMFFDSNDLIDLLFKFSIEASKTKPLLSIELFRLIHNFVDLSSYETAIYCAFKELPKEEKIELSKSANLREKIIENYLHSITNARITDLAIDVNEAFTDSPDFDQSFSDFVNKDVMQHFGLRTSSYGGRILKADENDDEEETAVESTEIPHTEF
ncbi:hypothetical protein M9Y10_000813 [Tritrichomonas musculus]|uniref:BACK domain-containing protein n=1 Tax=Tritrichomonas musculus TaxID=1915356 RepID=A0ABR2L584_9EUKA